MRPELGGNAQPSPPRKPSISADNITPLVGPSNAATSFFMTREVDTEKEKSGTSEQNIVDSSYGIRSIDDSASATDGGDEKQEQDTSNTRDKNRRRSTIRPHEPVSREESIDSLGRNPSISSSGSSPQRPDVIKSEIQLGAMSHPLTPISFASPVLGSEAPSSPKSLDGRSLRISDDEDLAETGSQVITSSAEEDNDGDENDAAGTQSMEGMQLVMPSIMMPTRRPFTDRGKQVGKMKVLFAGPSGAGKTSLIKSIVQVCEDIIHVDPPPSTSNESGNSGKSKSRPSNTHANPTRKVSEIYASTKPYPQWWQEHEESDSVTRRRSASECIVERNICFVDTPGYNSGTSMLEGMKTTLDYIESQMAKATSLGEMKETELLSMLSGNGGLQVDLVLYLIAHDLKSADVEYLRQLSHLTPTIPILAKSDSVLQTSLPELKPAILEQLRTANIAPFSLPYTSLEDLPYAICSSHSSDLESMDASLLMQPDFLPPLTPSDLSSLIIDLFNPENVTILKHASARKLLRWRSEPRASPAPLTAALSPSLTPSTSSPPSLPSTSLSPTSLTARQTTFSPLTHPRLAAHTRREEHLANIRLANWAGQLQRSLAAERQRYEDLARQERASWLKSKLEECKDISAPLHELDGAGTDNALVAVHESARSPRSAGSDAKRSSTAGDGGRRFRQCVLQRVRRGEFDAADPLGLVGFGERMRRGGWVAVRVLGGAGLVGGFAVLVARWNGVGGQEWVTVLREWWEGATAWVGGGE